MAFFSFCLLARREMTVENGRLKAEKKELVRKEEEFAKALSLVGGRE